LPAPRERDLPIAARNVAEAVRSARVDKTVWMGTARDCRYATFFHTPMWESAVLSAYPAFTSRTLAMRLESGGVAIYPLLEIGRRMGGTATSLVSTFAGCYGGPIATDPVSPADNARIHGLLRGWNRWRIDVTGNPLAPHEPVGGFRVDHDFTHVLAMSSDFNRIERGFTRRYREAIAKARKNGVMVAPASDTGDWERYFELYQHALAHWGPSATSRYPRPLFQSLCRTACEHPRNVVLWTARKDGQMIGGALVFYWNDHAVYWHGATDQAHARLSPAKLLLAVAIEHACSDGYSWFDFNPSGGHAGVATFKSRFGAELRPVLRFRWMRPPLRVARQIRQRLAS
jgi:hypothetical protein